MKLTFCPNCFDRLHSTKRAQRQQEIRWKDTRELLEARGVTRTSDAQVLAAQVMYYCLSASTNVLLSLYLQLHCVRHLTQVMLHVCNPFSCEVDRKMDE